MKTTLIKLQDKFILVSDEELNKGDKAFDTTTDNGIYSSVLRTAKDSYWNKLKLPKIIAGIPELPSIDFSLLSEEDCKTIGWVDVEKLAEIDRLNTGWNDTANLPFTSGFERGFKTSQSLNDKIFSEKQVINIVEKSRATGLTAEYIIQSLQQTSWDVEVEMEDYLTEELALKGSFKNYRPKITNNSIKIVKIL